MQKLAALVLYLTLLVSFGLSAQSAGYNTDRRSFTIIYVENEKKVGPYFRQTVPSEFQNSIFWNDIKAKSIGAPAPDLELIGRQLANMGLGNEIMAWWWNRRPDGSFTLDTIAARGRYNALALTEQVALKGPRGQAELEDAGLNLITESYVLVVAPKNLRTMKDEYDAQDYQARQMGDSKRAERKERGYVGQAEGYLYKLVYDDKAKSTFYDMWIYETDSPEVKKQKIDAFDSYRFQLQPMKMVLAKGLMGGDIRSTTSLTANKKKELEPSILDIWANTKIGTNGLVANSDEQLLAGWAHSAITKLLEEIVGKTIGENNFPIWAKKPVQSKIGRKEGVFPEKRFVVYERRERPDGSVINKKRAVVRAKRVTDNRMGSTGNFSRFYRVGGLGSVQPGMLLEPRREAGIGLHILYGLSLPAAASTGDGRLLRDFGGGIETNLSLYLGKLGMNRCPVGLKLGINYTMLSDELYVMTNDPVKANVTRLAIYLRKDFYFLSILRFGIRAGYGLDNVSKVTKSTGETKKSLSSALVPVGAELGLNLFAGLNAFGQAEYAFPVGDVQENDKARSDLEWYDLYPDRKGIVVRAGLRFSF